MRRIVQSALAIMLGLVLGQAAALAQETKNADSSATTAVAAKTTGDRTESKEKATPIATGSAAAKVDISLSEVKDIRAVSTSSTASQEPSSAPTPPSIYTVNSSAEVGWRFKASDGNLNQFRSDLNYDKGPRLFNSNLYMRNNDGGGVFDTLMVDSFGFGGDPSQYLKVDIEKTKWYRFDANYRRFDYFNSLSNFALGQHTNDLQFQVGDFDLTLLPRNERLKIYLGYSMDYDKGTQFTTYDFNRNEFPLFEPTHSRADDYRFGFDAKVVGFDLSFMQGFRYSRDDSVYLINTSPELGNEAGITPSNLATFERDVPTRGRIPYTRFSVHRALGKRVDFTARVIYSSATTHYTLSENATGVDLLGNTLLGDTTNVSGNAKRPNAIGDGAITIYATDKLSISDSFRVNSFRINGGDLYNESIFTSLRGVPNPAQFINTVAYQFIGEHLYQNTIEANYDLNSRLQFHGGYRYAHRDINQGNFTIPPGGGLVFQPFDNNTNSGFFGFKFKPVHVWSTYFDFERGTADNIFVRVGNYDYTNVRVRTLIRPTKTLTINGSLITKDNNNPSVTASAFPQPFGVNISSRTFSTSVDWTPSSKFFVSGGYTYNHLDSDAAIIQFLNFAQTLGSSLYFVRDHFFFVDSRVQLTKRVSAFGAFRINKDLGQGDRVATSPAEILTSYPLRYSDPEARITVNLNRHVDWNAGWQYYDYAETQTPIRNFKVHLAYVSLTLRMNRE